MFRNTNQYDIRRFENSKVFCRKLIDFSAISFQPGNEKGSYFLALFLQYFCKADLKTTILI